ncbi:MAG TPA: type III pantothenate kinase [Ignavibacteriales bacterium]|nr:type III pantothenate kinase [Ignavibacteriales bacterium]
MLLACDIGNTNSKFALYNGSGRVSFFVLNNLELVRLPEKIKDKLDECAISSVAPNISFEMDRIINSSFGIRPYFITAYSHLPFKLNYNPPDSLGTDRICAAAGALAFVKDNTSPYILAIDCGTATTANIVNSNKEFIGGLIMPGLFTMSDSLKKKTAQLPEVALENYNALIGSSTISCIQSGILNAAAGMIERTLNHLQNELKAGSVKLYITGGAAKYIIPLISPDFNYVEDLVLSGIKSIYEYNK